MSSLAVHISFFYTPSKVSPHERVTYIERIIRETNTYPCSADIYIHTNHISDEDNYKVEQKEIDEYKNGKIKVVVHKLLPGENPFFLTWKCRDLLKKQREQYEMFMYIEDDILVPSKTIQYWINYHKKLIKENYNLGFLRVESRTPDDHDYMTDIRSRLTSGIKFKYEKENKEEIYVINNHNPYCAFWIYDKEEFSRFVDSKFYNPKTMVEYHTREQSAIGLNSMSIGWYKNTIIPLKPDGTMVEECKIYHMPNNYARACIIKFNDVVKLHNDFVKQIIIS